MLGLFKKTGDIAGGLIKSVGGIIDGLSTSDLEKLEAKNKLSQTVLDSLSQLAKSQKEVIVTEAQGNWLQRSWRPVVMLAFSGIVVYSKFLAPLFDWHMAELEPQFWELLKLGIGGYVVGRSIEKVTDRVTQNVDLSFLKKRNRKINTDDTP